GCLCTSRPTRRAASCTTCTSRTRRAFATTSPDERTAMTGRRANVVGTGLIGGSLGLALRRRGWTVTGSDHDADRAKRALEVGAIDAIGFDHEADITFVAVPVLAITDTVKDALASTSGIVTDVGSVKAPIVRAVGDARFIGGHPMAGSEQEGIEGADPSMFEGAVWV